jgi:hypothetical protein
MYSVPIAFMVQACVLFAVIRIVVELSKTGVARAHTHTHTHHTQACVLFAVIRIAVELSKTCGVAHAAPA